MSTLWLVGCGGVPPDVVAKIAEFQDRASAGRLDEIRREYTPLQSDWEKYMSGRAALGRIISSTRVKVVDVTGHYRLVSVHNNTVFERGQAVEKFDFRMDPEGPRLIGYGYRVGKQMWCPTLDVFDSQCSIEDVPTPAKSDP